MKILEFRAENVKRVKLVVIRPGDDSLVQITGANAQGKSSTLDALGWLFGGAKPIQGDPIRAGADRAVIQADLGEIIVRRTLNRKEGGYTTALYVEAASGARFQKPQDVINGFMGALSFDPMDFMRAEPKAQYDMLRRFVPGVDFDALDAANRADYVARTDVNREIERKRQAAGAIQFPADLPVERVDEAALLERMAGAAQTNATIEAERATRERAAVECGRLRTAAQECLTNAATLRKQADDLDERAARMVEEAEALEAERVNQPELPSPVDVSDVRAQIEQARTINRQIDRRDERDRLLREAGEQEWVADGLTDAIEARKRQKEEAIAAAEMPVDGLTFGEGVVLLNGHPLDQASGAEQLRTSVAIAMAMNPTLQVIRVRDGNALDDNHLRMLGEMADEKGYQVWIERRLDASGAVGFYIEDGQVKARPVEQAA